jgi:anti-sigma28 factor (negative regulator of flagellin synthesis)
MAADMKNMRVDQRNLTGAAETGRSRETQSIGRDGRSVSSTNQGGSGNDRVELSTLSRALTASASSRSSRIDQLTAQYQAGQYQPDPAETSKSMLADALSGSAM